jgi:hypothetical protein
MMAETQLLTRGIMLIAVDDGFVINLKEFDTMSLTTMTKKVKKKVSGGFLGLFPTFESEDKIDKWALTIFYTKPDGSKTSYCITCEDRKELCKSARRVLKQIQQYDPSVITAAFEEAFFKEDTK